MRSRTATSVVVLGIAVSWLAAGSPFLGSSRLEDPLVRYPVTAVFHGHAHRGALEGRTVNGRPVYNVAKPLLLRTGEAGAMPFKLLDVATVEAPRSPAA